MARAIELGRDLAGGVAAALAVEGARVRFVATYTAPAPSTSTSTASLGDAAAMLQYMALDLLPCEGCDAPDAGSTAGGAPSANDLATRLAELMASRARELYARSSTQAIQSSAGLLQVHSDGSTTTLERRQ